jgi:hypothetical protein
LIVFKYKISRFGKIIYFLFLIIISCSQNTIFKVPQTIPDDRNHVPKPASKNFHLYGEYFDRQIILQLDEFFDFSRQYRNLTGTRKESINVDAFGEVANSSWFTNRNSFKKMSGQELIRGPNSGSGPDKSGFWTITRAKVQGVTPGFSIKDNKGDNYLIKFDPQGYPELASGAEVISTKLFYAMGYNTPENYIVYFDPQILKLKDDVTFTDRMGRKRAMNKSDLQEILDGIQKLPNGDIRALASKYLDGVPIGPFQYKGIRKDDYNDLIPHQHRRELRGLWILSAWLNHFDTKDSNSLDMYVTENGKSFVKHFLIDFGATLGSASHGPNYAWRGYQYDIDPGIIFANIFTFGLYIRPWEKFDGVKYPSIGVYNAEPFEPMKYRPLCPNPAFENMTLLDGYWAAKIVMSFTDQQLKVIIGEAQYSDPEAENYLFRVIKERRDIIGEYFFSRVNPLDKFKIETSAKNGPTLVFSDLAVESGLIGQNDSYYKFSCMEYRKDKPNVLDEGQMRSTSISLVKVFQQLSKNSSFKLNNPSESWIIVNIQTQRGKNSAWSKPVKIFLEMSLENNTFKIIGIKRQT